MRFRSILRQKPFQSNIKVLCGFVKLELPIFKNIKIDQIKYGLLWIGFRMIKITIEKNRINTIVHKFDETITFNILKINIMK